MGREHRTPARLATARPAPTFAHTHMQLYLVLSFAIACITYDSTQVGVLLKGQGHEWNALLLDTGSAVEGKSRQSAAVAA